MIVLFWSYIYRSYFRISPLDVTKEAATYTDGVRGVRVVPGPLDWKGSNALLPIATMLVPPPVFKPTREGDKEEATVILLCYSQTPHYLGYCYHFLFFFATAKPTVVRIFRERNLCKERVKGAYPVVVAWLRH